MKRSWLVLLWSAPALAAISGSVVNGTTGELLPGAVVSLHELGRKGAAVAQAKSDARGRFRINRENLGPHLVRTIFDGVAYESILPLEAPVESVSLVVYRSSKERGAARVRSHTVRFEPASGGLLVSETFQYVNEGAVTWNDPRGGALRFYLPPSARGKMAVKAAPPGGSPAVQAAAVTGKRDIYQVDFPVRPGATQVDVTYSLPNMEGAVYHGEVVTQADATLLSAANGFELSGAGLRQKGREYLVVGSSYDVTLTAKPGTPAPAQKAETAVPENAPTVEGPRVQQTIPRVYGRAPVLLALMCSILGLGFVRLYRMPGDRSGSSVSYRKPLPDGRGSDWRRAQAREREMRGKTCV